MKVTEVWNQLSSSTIDKMSAINAFESRDKFTKDTDLDVETLKHLVKINLVITKKKTPRITTPLQFEMQLFVGAPVSQQTKVRPGFPLFALQAEARE